MAILDTSHRMNYLASVRDQWKHAPDRGYSSIIVAFVNFVENKVKFHTEHRGFPDHNFRYSAKLHGYRLQFSPSSNRER